MARKNIFDILSSQYNMKQEMSKITKLFNTKMFVYTNPLNFHNSNCSLEEIVDDKIFYSWKQRGFCINCSEMKEEIGINGVYNNIDDVIKHLEYYINILELARTRLGIGQNLNYSCNNYFPILCRNINLLLEHINYERFTNQQEEKVILIPKNPAATAVAEISTKNTAMAILQYHHASLKGNLDEKRKLLIAIAHEYETLLKNPINGFSDYFKKATDMLNNLNIRHNNMTGKNKKDLLKNMSDTELEKWYDELYQLLLFCVLIKDNVKRKRDIEQFLAKVNPPKAVVSSRGR